MMYGKHVLFLCVCLGPDTQTTSALDVMKQWLCSKLPLQVQAYCLISVNHNDCLYLKSYSFIHNLNETGSRLNGKLKHNDPAQSHLSLRYLKSFTWDSNVLPTL